MFIKSLEIQNFRLFKNNGVFTIGNLNIPNATDEGTGLNVVLGENGCGKTSILDAISLALLEYKADGFDIEDINDPNEACHIRVLADSVFDFDGFVPRSSYKGKGFEFEAKIRSRDANGYLSSILVNDQRYMRADGETKPEDGKPELRISVNNPWRGKRYSETDVIYLDKGRMFQTRRGTYNQTRFDRLMEDYGYQFLKRIPNPPDYDKALAGKIAPQDNEYLAKAIEKFKEISGEDVRLSTIDNFEPFKTGFFAVHKENNQQLKLDSIGSGYAMIFTLLYSYYLAVQSGKKMILMIDEPELHMHPKLQDAFSKFLLELSKDVQIFITTHSPVLLKQLMQNEKIKVMSLIRDTSISLSAPSEQKLSYLSANELNFIAFGYATEEYHNELYEEIYLQNNGTGIKPFDIAYFQAVKHEPADKPWRGTPNQVSIHTHIRNQIHHRGELGSASNGDIESSIIFMRNCL